MGYTQVGRDLTGVGILAQYGGTFQQGSKYGGDLTISRGGTGVVYLAGGTLASSVGLSVGQSSDNSTTRGFAELTVAGSADVTLNGNVSMADRTNMFATVNLNGGRLSANTFTKGNRYGSLALLNFDGGTFRARAAGNLFGTGVNALDGVYVYPGGAVIDTTNLNVTANVNLQAPLGNGVASITLAPRDGYIGPPFVTISGTGVGATALAQFDSQSGFVTGVTITSPGRDFTGVPNVTLSGGGTNLQTTVTGVTLAPNASGGLTKRGSGTLTLNGTNTYGGATTLENGTLKIAHALALPGASTVTFAGGTLDLSGMTLTNAVNVTGALTGGLTNGTLQTVFSPAGEHTLGVQNYALAVRASGTLRGTYVADAVEAGASDRLAVQGNIDLSNIALQIVDTLSLDRSVPYTLLTCTGTRTGTFSSTNLPNSRWRLVYQPDGTVKLIYVDGTVLMLK
jgi:autotransporter-associated beta strand protein